MADCSDGGGQMNAAMLPSQLTLDSLLDSEAMKEGESSAEESGAAGILGDILEMEGTEAELKEEDASLMAALAECEAEEQDDDDEDFESEDDEGDDEEEDSDDEEDDEEDENDDEDQGSEEEEEEEEELDLSKGAEESMDFGEMPDFSSMMEADGTSLEGAVGGDAGLKALQETGLMEACDTKSEPGTSSGKVGSGKKASKKRKRKMPVKDKQPAKRSKKERKKRKRAKKDEEKIDPSTLKPSERRRNIRKIIGEQDLDKETLDAQKEELDRQHRLMEQKKHAMSSMAASSKPAMVSSSTGTSTSHTSSSVKEQDSQLKSLLQSAEEEAENREKKKAEISIMTETKKTEIKKEFIQVKQEKVDVIELSSDSEDESNEDDCVMVPSTEEEEEEEIEAEDLNDGGAHINDEFNRPDDQGRVLVNVGHPNDDPDIFLSPQVAKAIKPHQIGGVRFLYDNLVETLPRFNTSQGFGCILAHSMGLGKTIQIIAFIDIFLRHTSAKKVLCIVPINTLQNWMAEFNMWAPAKEKPAPPNPPPPPKSKDSEKRSRDRSKKDKDSNKESKASSKESKGHVLSSTMGSIGPGMGHMGGPGMGHMGGPGMGQMSGPGMNQMGGPGMGPMSGMMGPMGGPMNQMGGPGMGPMGGPGMSHMGGSMNQMGGPGMDPMGGSNMGSMSGHGMGHMGGHNMGGPGMNYMGHMGGGMHSMNHMGGSGGHFMGPMGMPWMSSTMGQHQYGNIPYGPPGQNPMGNMNNMGHSSMGPPHMHPSTSVNPSSGNVTSMNPMGTPTSESMNTHSVSNLMSSASSENPMSSSSSNSIAAMSSMNPVNNPGNSLNAGNPMGTPPPASPMNSRGNPMGLGNSISAENPMGTAASSNQMGMPSLGNPMSTSSNENLMGSLSSVDPAGPGPGSGNAMGAGPGNSMNMGPGHPMGPGFGNPMGIGPMGAGPANPMSGGFGHQVSSSMNPMNSLASMTPPVGGLMGASMNAASPVNPMSALSSMNPVNTPPTGSGTPPVVAPSMTPSGNSGMDASSVPPISSSGDAPATPVTDSQSSASPAADKETFRDSVKIEPDTKLDSKPEMNAKIKSEIKEEKVDGGKEDETGAVKQEIKKESKPSADGIEREEGDTAELRHRNYKILLLNDSCKTTAQRAKIIGEWHESGGVLLIGYEMYRLLASRRTYTPKPKKKKKKADAGKEQHEVIDVDEEDKNKNLMTDMHGALVNPGPDLVICDEGHRIKNNHASISQSLKQIRTRRRVVLTGYPLQNNLMEYWCMVDFVRPNFLGNKTEFSNMFERPIMNGQCHDSTAEDLKIMKHRAYVLHNLLEGFVQRRGHTVLQHALPFKHEYVFLIRMSPIQRKLYRRFMDSLEDASCLAQANNNPLKAFSVGCKIWNHPDILHKSVVLKKPVTEENDLDIESSEVGGSKKKLKKSDSSSSLASTASMSSMASSASNATIASKTSNIASFSDIASSFNAANGDMPNSNSTEGGFLTPEATNSSETTTTGVSTGTGTTETGIGTGPGDGGRCTPMFDKKEDENAWVGDAFEDYESGVLEHGPKMVLLNTIIEESLKTGDKILVFSQSLSTLDTIEEFLSKQKVPRPDMDENWAKNKSYFRLDGSTSSTERERLINEFNRPANNSSWIFLLSTRAGCLGINMIGANRVVVLDASWNPCHDCQAVCRVFRFGQTKQSYVYRLVTENTLERNIYDRQITKQGMSDRVIDEMNPDNHFSKRQLENLLKNEDKDYPYLDFSQCDEVYDDPVMVNVLKKQGQWMTKEPFTHESLLIDRKELRMSRKEKLQAKEGYARDKRMNITYSRPSYSAYYPGGVGQQMYIRRGPISRPIASVRPMISTPVPRPSVQVVKPGVTVHQVITTTDILLPGTNTATSSGTAEPAGKIASGQKILVIKTPKGVYIRTNDGKMFAVRSKVGGVEDAVAGASATVGGASTTTTTTATTVSSGTRVAITPPPPRIFFKTPDGKLTEKNPNEVKGGSSLLASIYSQTSAVSALMKGNKKGQITRVIPAAPIRTLSRPRPTIMASAAAANKAAKPPVEVIVYPRSKVISTGRACKVLDKAGDATGKSASTVVVPPQKDSATGASGSATEGSDSSSSSTTDSSTLTPIVDTSSGKTKDSQVMKLLASDSDGEKVGRSTTMATSTVPDMKDSGVAVSLAPTAVRTNGDSATSPGGRGLADSVSQSGPAASVNRKESMEQKDFVVPAPPRPASSLSSDVPKQDGSSQGNSSSGSLPSPQAASLPQSQHVNPALTKSLSPMQQSSQPLPQSNHQPFKTNLPPFPSSDQQAFSNPPLQQPFNSQQPFNNQPPPQPMNSQLPFNTQSSQQSFSSQQQSFGNQLPQPPFSSQPSQLSFNNQPSQQSFNSQPPQQSFNNQPPQQSFNNQPPQQPFSSQSQQQQFGSQPQQNALQSQHAQMPNSQQQPNVQQPQQYHQQRSDYMQSGPLQPTPPPQPQSQFHQPWGQPQPQPSYMPPPGFPDYSSYPQQPTAQPQPQPQQQMMQTHHSQQQQPMSPFTHSQHPPSGPSVSGNMSNPPFGVASTNSTPSPGQVQGQHQGQNEPGQPDRTSAFRPPSGGSEKLPSVLDSKNTPTPPSEHQPQQAQQQQPPQAQQAPQQQQPAQQQKPQQPPPQQPPPQQQQQQQVPPAQSQQPAQPVVHPTPQHRDGRYQDNWWPSSSMGGGGAGSGSSNSQPEMSGGSAGGPPRTPSSSTASSTSSYPSSSSAFTPTNPAYFHPGLSPFGMPSAPQSNFSMMGQGLGMPGSYPFMPSFHPGFMGSPFSQGLGGGGSSGFGSSGGSSTGTYGGYGGQSSESMGSFRALLEESPDRSPVQPSNSSTSGMGSSASGSNLASDGGTSGLGMNSSSNTASSMGSSMGNSINSSSTPMSGLGGSGAGGMNGLPPTPSMQPSSSSMYGSSPMSLGYHPGLFPMLNPMPTPMFMPMMPSPMMGQHYPMQPSHNPPPGPLSAMGHMAAMGSHLSSPGLPPPPGGGS